jgi:uncharacterized OB-fold protein
MSMIDDQAPTVRAPMRVAAIEDQPFWDAIDADTFVLARCACGAYSTRSQACLRCGASALSQCWVPVSGQGTIRTFVIFDKPYHPYFEGRVPYVVAVIALSEGPELITNVIDIDVSAVTIGMPVKIVIVERGGQKIHQASTRV